MFSGLFGGCGAGTGLWPGGGLRGWAEGPGFGCGVPAFRPGYGGPLNNECGCGSPFGSGFGCGSPISNGFGCGAPFGFGTLNGSFGCGAPFGIGFGTQNCGFGCSCGCAGDCCSECCTGYHWCDCPACNPLGGYGDGPCGGYVSYRDRFGFGC